MKSRAKKSRHNFLICLISWIMTLRCFYFSLCRLSLTLLKTAGFGSGGPNGGTSSLAVTDTCWHEINKSLTLWACNSEGLGFQAGRMNQCQKETWEHCHCRDEWFVLNFVYVVIYISTFCFFWQFETHSVHLAWFIHLHLLQNTGLLCTLYVVCSVQGFSTCTST